MPSPAHRPSKGWPAACASSIALSWSIWALYSLNMASFGSSLILGLFLMFFALFAYLKVDNVSS